MQSFLPNMFYYGFPVVLLTTTDEKGNANITPISCTFTLKYPCGNGFSKAQ